MHKLCDHFLTFPFFIFTSGGFIAQDCLLLPLFKSLGATDFLLPKAHKRHKYRDRNCPHGDTSTNKSDSSMVQT